IGVALFGGQVTSGGGAAITVSGTGGNGVLSDGVFISGGSIRSTAAAPALLSITGQASNGSSAGITLTNRGQGSWAVNVNLTGRASTIVEADTTSLVSAALLTTSSAGGTTLNGANTVSSFNATNTTSGAISLSNTATTLTITGISNSGGGNIAVQN